MSARSLNRVLLIGNLTRDPEVRYTPGGTAVCTFGLATNRTWTPADGSEPQEETEYHRIVAWSKLAEICGQILQKGRKVFVEGRLSTRKWTSQDGQERTVTEIVIDNMIALSPMPGGDRGDRYQAYNQEPMPEQSVEAPAAKPKASAKAAPVEAEPEDVNLDDIPF